MSKPSFLSDLSIQSWIVMAMFTLYILYMLFMTFSSPAYRMTSKTSNAWMFLYMVMLVLAYAVIVTVGVSCAAGMGASKNTCAMWSWLITGLVVFGVLYTIFMSMMARSKEKEAFSQKLAR